MSTRRKFVHWAGAALSSSWLASSASALEEGAGPTAKPMSSPLPKTGSDVGSLFQFIQSQTVTSDFPLSFLRDEFKDLNTWKRQARAKLLELLHYAPPRCESGPEVVERTDKGDYVREKVY